MKNVFYRSPTQNYPTAVRAQGCWIVDDGGRKYLDGSGGAAVSSLGHGCRRVIDAIKNQAEALPYAHTAFFTNAPQEKLAARLAALFHEPDAKAYFTSGGSESTETALKLARAYHMARGDSERAVIISREGSYHGATLGALGVSGTRRRVAFEAMTQTGPRIAPCYAYRFQSASECQDDYALRAARALEDAILSTGPSRVAAFIAEPVVGSTLGAVPAAPGYFKAIRKICDEYGVLLICDEVMSGAGRTGPYLASDKDNAQPDIVTLGKGLGAGYQPLGAVICRGFIHDAIAENTGAFDHGHTYIGHPIACAAGNAVLDEIEDAVLLDGVVEKGARLHAMLIDRLSDHPNVGDIRGRGLMLGVEFVDDKATKRAFSGSTAFASALRKTAMENGLICYPDGGNIDGAGAHVLLAPPFIISDEEMSLLVDRLASAVEQLLPVRVAA